MRYSRVVLLVAAAGLLSACSKDDEVILAPKVPIAFTRFIHAVPDTSAMDWRFVDALENSPVAFGLAFRGFTPYQATGVGQRHLRIFPTSTDINITSQIVIDETITLAENVHYTLVHVGLARAGATPSDKLLVIQDDFTAPTTGNIALRAVNLGTGLGNLDFFAVPTGGTAPPAPTFGNLAYLAATTYGTRTPGAFSMRVTAAGQAAPVMIDATVPAGDAGNPANNADPIGGSTLSGSVISAFAFPRSVAGSLAPQTTAFQSPAMVYLIDKSPPR